MARRQVVLSDTDEDDDSSSERESPDAGLSFDDRRPYCMYSCPCRSHGWVYREPGLFKRHCAVSHATASPDAFRNLTGEPTRKRRAELARLYKQQPKAAPARRKQKSAESTPDDVGGPRTGETATDASAARTQLFPTRRRSKKDGPSSAPSSTASIPEGTPPIPPRFSISPRTNTSGSFVIASMRTGTTISQSFSQEPTAAANADTDEAERFWEALRVFNSRCIHGGGRDGNACRLCALGAFSEDSMLREDQDMGVGAHAYDRDPTDSSDAPPDLFYASDAMLYATRALFDESILEGYVAEVHGGLLPGFEPHRGDRYSPSATEERRASSEEHQSDSATSASDIIDDDSVVDDEGD